MRMIRTSVEIPEDLYKAFQTMGGRLSHVVRDAVRDYIGIKGASEDSLAVLELKLDRLAEEKLSADKRLTEIEGASNSVRQQIDHIKSNIDMKDKVNDQAKIMREDVNPYIRGLKYEVDSITPELHEMLLRLKEVGLTHNLESMQKHAEKLKDADWLMNIRS